MRKIAVLLSCLTWIHFQLYSAESVRHKKLELLSKVWGYTIFKTEKKIAHPDRELLNLIKSSKIDESFDKFQKRVIQWHHKNFRFDLDQSQTFREVFPKSFAWVQDTNLLSSSFSKYLLEFVPIYTKKGNPQYTLKDFIPNFYYDKEFANTTDTLIEKGYYLLAGIKYWNIVNYFYPYATDSTMFWNNALQNIITNFDTISSYHSYYLTLLRTSKTLNDGHSRVYSSWASENLFKYEIPFEVEVYEDFAIVSKIDTANGLIQKKDNITAINGVSISDHLKYWDALLSYSTRGWFLHTVRNYLFSSPDSIMNFTIVRNGREFNTNFSLTKGNLIKTLTSSTIYNLNKDSIGYIDLGNLQIHHIPALKKELEKAKAIIVDARKYPNSTLLGLSSWLIDESKLFAYHTIADSKCIGNFQLDSSTTIPNRDKYDGTVVLILDRSTISQGEFTAMAFIQSSNLITIGRRTAGSVGLTSTFFLPGDISCRISTSSVTFPNKQIVQRTGIKPDIDLSMNSEILLSDEILGFAYKYIKKIILKRE